MISYTIGGTADAGADYTALSGTVTILAGDTTATIDVAVLDDSIIEPTETVEVTLTAITSGDADISVGSPNSATVDITDDELNQTVTVIAIDPDATEDTDSGEFKIALSNISSTDTVVTFSLEGEAVLGVDYQLFIDGVLVTGNEITIPAGQMMVNVEVRPLNDNIVELNEDVIFTLDSVAGDADISIDSSSDTATVIINDDGDTAEVTLTPVNTEASEQPAGTGVTNGEFLLELSNPSSTPTVVDFSATPDGNQTLGAIRAGFETSALAHLQGDYRILADGVEVTGDTFTIPAGTTEVTITIEVIDDVVVETIENFDLTLTGINSADPQISVGSTVGGNVTITDDDQAEIIVKAIQDASEPGQSADDNGFFQVLLIVPGSVDAANPNGIPAPVSYDIEVLFSVTGTANQIPGDRINPVDFEELESVQFAPGITTDVIAVTPEDDLLVEGDETVTLTLTPNTVNSNILDNLFNANVTEVFVTESDCNDATVAIMDDDFEAGPTITGVFVSSTFWSQGFLDAIDGVANDGLARGYFIPSGTNQLQTLPWVNINQISVVFSEDVTNLDIGDFSFIEDTSFLTGDGSGTSGVLPNIAGVTYDPSTFTATLSFDPGQFFESNAFDLVVNASGVQNSSDVDLDGEWVNQSGAAESGDGTPGGDFVFRILTLPGDTVDLDINTGSDLVTGSDADVVRVQQNEFAFEVMGSTVVSANFNPRADLDGSGLVSAADAEFSRVEQNAFLFQTSSVVSGGSQDDQPRFLEDVSSRTFAVTVESEVSSYIISPQQSRADAGFEVSSVSSSDRFANENVREANSEENSILMGAIDVNSEHDRLFEEIGRDSEYEFRTKATSSRLNTEVSVKETDELFENWK